ncbi:MAG: aminotransferase class I/II-fold pyridoxal phosphate-dependent enzyme [Chloroflexi bacterium]|nr:aminotransferase class I/II-fold pyridoxal phosphate-dependent enzyme [Chloroflexota bacterium]
MLPPHQFAHRMQAAVGTMTSFLRFFQFYAEYDQTPDLSDFAVGNPHEMPLPGFVDALQRAVVPQNKDWFAYKMNEQQSCETVAQSLRLWRGVPFEADDIHMTTAGFAAIAVTLNAVVNPGDEVIFITPPWFFYEPLITAAGGTPVRVAIDSATFDLDLAAISDAITPNTCAIIVNSPHNPTGKIYPPATLQALANLLTEASERYARPIYLLSDEAYSRIVYDGARYPSPTEYYPTSFLLYTYGKTLLTPGQRIGYIALPPTMPDREVVRQAIFGAQVLTGYSFPNALLQHALPDLEKLSIDIEQLQHKRDWLVGELQRVGYDVHTPEGTFYLLPRSPLADDWAFVERLGQLNILCLPGTVVEQPGYFRISLTANEDMIERALPGFATAFEGVRH